MAIWNWSDWKSWFSGWKSEAVLAMEEPRNVYEEILKSKIDYQGPATSMIVPDRLPLTCFFDQTTTDHGSWCGCAECCGA